MDNTAASFSSQTFTPDRLIVGTIQPLARKVTVASGQNLLRGAVLGVITSGGKYKLSASAAGDGSQTPDAILAADCDATSADAEALVFERADVNQGALNFGTGHDATTVRATLRGKGINLIKIVSP